MNLDVDRLCPNEPDIASKIIDGEAILINLQTGAYYSLRDAGALVWHVIGGHCTQREIVDIVGAAYRTAPATLDADVAALLARLRDEHLIRASDRHGAAEHVEPPPASPAAYQPPVLEKFTDMEELLALDPPTPGALDNLMRQPLGERAD